MKSSLVILNNEGELKRSSINTALRKMCEQIIKKLKLNEKKADIIEQMKWEALHGDKSKELTKQSVKKPKKKVVKVSWWQKVKTLL